MRIAITLLSVLLISVAVESALLNKPTFKAGEFKGKIVLVTGGSSGIGFATALLFAQNGAKVTICSRDSHPTWRGVYNGSASCLSINTDQTVRANGGSCRWIKADVSDYNQAQNVIDTIYSLDGTLDIAVNNAAIGGALGTVNTLAPYLRGEHDPILNNVYGVINMMVLQTNMWIKEGKNGVIVNTASADGLHGCPQGSMYGASKHAIIGLTKSVALEFAKGTPQIRVNAIAPGLTDTPFTWEQVKWMDNPNVQSWQGPYVSNTDPLWLKYGPGWAEQLPNGVLAEPVDMANMICFLASDSASYISGAVMSVDFGLAAI